MSNLVVSFLPCQESHAWKRRRSFYRDKQVVCLKRQFLQVFCKYIVGINKYSHDASVCLVNSHSGDIVLNCAKERFSRRKHDGGDVGELMEHICARIGVELEDIDLVVQNNHHYNIRNFEEKLPWTSEMNYYPKEYLSVYNVLPRIPKIEISHHLAHAWSVYPQLEAATSSSGDALILVMDGMGESTREFSNQFVSNESLYIHDLMTSRSKQVEDWHDLWKEKCYPKEVKLFQNLREAESCYKCSKNGVELLWKRWTRETSPPELYNHSFEDMESIGAVYSRIASHIFGDWNSCGKVMGLAAYHVPKQKNTTSRWKEWIRRLDNENIISGHLPERVDIHWSLLKQLPCPNKWNEQDEDLCQFYAALAYRIQKDTESLVLSSIETLSNQHEVPILGLCGGLFLNSSLNGKILNQSYFRHVWIPPYPGDEGIAIGCALYGYHYFTRTKGYRKSSKPEADRNPSRYVSPFLGLPYSDDDIEEAVRDNLPWIEELRLSGVMEDQKKLVAFFIAEELYKDKIVAVFRGRAESGPRALGNRSILANPCDPSTKEKLNRRVKFREAFRPFAPSVLEESLGDIFELSIPIKYVSESCRYMSATLPVKEEFVSKIPAVVHMDKTARAQVLTSLHNSWFQAIVAEFYKLSKIPVVLNTSFNIRGEPIVESPNDALETFLDPSVEIDWLVLEDRIFRKKSFPRHYHSMNVALRRPVRIHITESPVSEETSWKVVDVNGNEYKLLSDIDATILHLASTNKYKCDDIVRELLEESAEPNHSSVVVARLEVLWKLRLITLL